MSRIVIVAIVACLHAVPAAAENRALIIGVGDYQDPAINDLPGVNLDIEMMRKVAIELGFKPEQIKILFDKQASLAGVRTAFDEWLVGGTGPGDKALFYYSGHGAYVPDKNGDEEDGRDEVLVLWDAHVVGSDLQNVLVDDDFGEWLTRLQAKTSYVLIDSCHSGSVTKGVRAPQSSVVKYFSYRGVPPATTRSLGSGVNFVEGRATRASESNRYVALTAAADSEQSLASPKGSYFTLGVQKAIANGAKNKKISLREVEKEAAEEIARLASADSVHHPQLGGNLALADVNLFDTTGPGPGPGPGPSPSAGENWTLLEMLADEATERLQISRVRPSYTSKDQMEIEIVAPKAGGYLNIFTVSAVTDIPTILFPNRRESENRMTGTTMVLPASGARYQITFELPQGVSEERNLLVAFVTDERLNSYQLSSGQAIFRELTKSGVASTRGAVITDVGGFMAGKIIYVLK